MMIKYLQTSPSPTHHEIDDPAAHQTPKSNHVQIHTKHPSNPPAQVTHFPNQPHQPKYQDHLVYTYMNQPPLAPSLPPTPLRRYPQQTKPPLSTTSLSRLVRHRPAPPPLQHHITYSQHVRYSSLDSVSIYAIGSSLGMYLKKEEKKKEEVYAALAIRMHARSLIHTLTRYTIPTSTIGLPRTPQKRNKALNPTPIPNARKCTSIASPPCLDSPRSPLPVAIPILILAIVLIVLPPPVPLPLSIFIVSISVVSPSFVIAIAFTLLLTLVLVFYMTVS